jgi:hypothetical protein
LLRQSLVDCFDSGKHGIFGQAANLYRYLGASQTRNRLG